MNDKDREKMTKGRTQEEITKDLREWHARWEALKHELQRAIVAEIGVEIGDIVVAHRRRWRVVAVHPTFKGQKPWVEANPQKKDGSFGVSIRNLFRDWEKEDQPE